MQAIAFPPRGGSAQVVRYLTRALTARGVDVLVVSGSLRVQQAMGTAAAFYGAAGLKEVDYTEASEGYRRGADPMSDRFARPLSPSYEDRAGVADRVFYRVDAGGLARLVRNWRQELATAAQPFAPDVLHLHHLHHVHLAALQSSLPGHPATLAHLHGTELKMIRGMRDLADDPSLHIALWDDALRRAALGVDHLVVNSDAVAGEAHDLLGVPRQRITVVPNGVDTDLFTPEHRRTGEKLRRLRGLLVEAPRGWDESGRVGSIRYTEADLRSFVDERGALNPILVYAGRFLAFKRVDLLLEAVSDLTRSRGIGQFNLLVCGGSPGEWEGEHPYAQAKRLALANVFFCGWLEHDELAQTLNLADVFVAPSSHEPFGQVYLEAMAAALPVIATRSGGPADFVVGQGSAANGWLCAPDDRVGLVEALAAAISDAGERSRRGANGRDLVHRRYSWASVSGQFVTLYERLRRGR